jgi:uncharacterized damage-inducible protein DinB
MKAEQARAVAEAMAGVWEMELPATAAVIEAVRDEGRDYRPHPKSRSAWELLTHLAMADVWFIDSIVQGAFAWDEASVQARQAEFGSVADVAAFYRATLPGKLAELRGLPDAALAESVDFFGMMQMPRAQWIGFAGNHSVHHRGQLSAYLRSMGCRVPDIYGPSADAEPAATP